jgi:hypothetical protein
MNKWMTSKDSVSFLSKARKKIDKNYGSGTFKTLYKNVQIILSIMYMYSSNGKELVEKYKEEKEKGKFYKSKNIFHILCLIDMIRKCSKELNIIGKGDPNYDSLIEKAASAFREYIFLENATLYQDIKEFDLNNENKLIKKQ